MRRQMAELLVIVWLFIEVIASLENISLLVEFVYRLAGKISLD